MVDGAEPVGNPVLAAVADEQEPRVRQWSSALGAHVDGIGETRRFLDLAGLPVRARVGPRHHVLEPAEDRAPLARGLSEPEAVAGLHVASTPATGLRHRV